MLSFRDCAMLLEGVQQSQAQPPTQAADCWHCAFHLTQPHTHRLRAPLSWERLAPESRASG